MKLNYQKSSKSFTLTEILVVVAIITILTASTLAGLRIQRTQQRLIGDAQKVVALLEKARAYAANPRTQDYRPIYYLVRFDLGVSGNPDLHEENSRTVSLYWFQDTDNDGDGDIGTLIETTELQNTHVVLNNNHFQNIENIAEPSNVQFKVCTGGFISLGFKVGEPHRILGRCYFSAAHPNKTVSSPHLIFSDAFLKIEFSDPDIQSAFNRRTVIKISGYGETIQTCQENPDVCY